MTQMAGRVRPTQAWGKNILTIKLRATVTGLPVGASVEVADVLFQAGGTVTGWVPHVTEMPWTSGIVGG